MRILVIEDEARLARAIARVLEQEKFDVDVAPDGDVGLDLALTGAYDVAVVDRMLPGLDGLSLLRHLRRERVDTPVLMLTALGDLPERLEGLDAGADDYLGKPFAFEELLARIRALSRRNSGSTASGSLTIGPLTINFVSHQVTVDGRLVDLTPQEFRVLEVLARKHGRIVSRDDLLERAWGPNADRSSNVVDLYVYYLRKKLSDGEEATPPLIRTVRGAGYVLQAGG